MVGGTVAKTLAGGGYDDAYAISTLPCIGLQVTLARPLSNFFMRIGLADSAQASQPIVGFGVYGGSLRCGTTAAIGSSCGWYAETLAVVDGGSRLLA